MAKHLNRITVDPNVPISVWDSRLFEVCMRIAVAFVLKMMASGMTHEVTLKAYPELEKAHINQTIEFASWLAGEYHYPLKNVVKYCSIISNKSPLE